MTTSYTDAHLIFRDYHTKASVYVGNMYAASDATFFIRNHIGAVVNATPDVPLHFEGHNIAYKRLVVDDSGRNHDMHIMYNAFPEVVGWINKQMMDGNNILIHCHAGMQRSATIAAAYMLRYYRRPLDSIIEFMQRRRPIVFGFGRNVNFIGPLRKWAKTNGVK